MNRQSMFLILSCLTGVLASAQSLKELPSIQPLAGVWKMGSGAKSFYEQWHWVSSEEIAGKSYKLKERDTIVFESTRIRSEAGQTNYLSQVKNQNGGKEIPFKLLTAANQTLVFENPTHDFPQRIIYQFITADSLHAWIEGNHDGKKEREDYFYSRVR
jgi:uncharacterized protein DUF6265